MSCGSFPRKARPCAAGVFKPDEHGNAMMMDHPMPEGVEAKAFAITVEKEEGSDKPTSPIMLMGAGDRRRGNLDAAPWVSVGLRQSRCCQRLRSVYLPVRMPVRAADGIV